jgi:hypothetical protein
MFIMTNMFSCALIPRTYPFLMIMCVMLLRDHSGFDLERWRCGKEKFTLFWLRELGITLLHIGIIEVRGKSCQLSSLLPYILI